MAISLYCFAVIFLISNAVTFISSNSFVNLTTDQQALLAFKNSVARNVILLKSWTVHTPTCRWTGVSCSPKHQRVTSLNISRFLLLGTLSPHIGNLSFLRLLRISHNYFRGSLPLELSKLRRLEEIDVGNNEFTGEIPSGFGQLTQLRRMYLDANAFSGRIPPSLFNITKLQILDLGYNDLSGQLPNNICRNIAGLKSFTVYFNQLEGEILPSICSCRELQLLQLQGNQFNGDIPPEIGSLSKLESMHIWSNHFTGYYVLQQMNEAGISPNVVTYNSLMAGATRQHSLSDSLFEKNYQTVLICLIRCLIGE